MMARQPQPQPRPHLSITMPRSFQSIYGDGQQTPQTPAAQPELAETPQPPSVPRQTFKVRRRRVDNTQEQAILEASPLPTIEMTEAGQDMDNIFGPELAPGYLAPAPGHVRLVSPPCTPASQLTTYSTDSTQSNEWSAINDVRGNPIERPRSVCSNFSDSSADSFGSSNGSYSLGGSCTSPESDAADPFCFYQVKSGPPTFPSLSSSADLPTAKRAKTSRHPKWTPEMDNHLWITYMFYMQDPRVTPFKTLPGTSPPLGVCHRVAREARRTWKGQRGVDRLIPRISVQRAGSPDAMEGGTTPTPTDPRSSAGLSRWPRSEAATRRHLRELCKRKPSLSAHYMRLLRTRSPSPFESSSPHSHANATPERSTTVSADVSAFSSRDMNVSLVAATAPSMQTDGPLSSLSMQAPAVTPAQPAHRLTPATTVERPAFAHQAPSSSVQRPTEWFARIGRSQARTQAHQKSQSLQLGLGLNSWSGPNTSFERGSILASPFDSDVGQDPFIQNMNATRSLGRGNAMRRPDSASSVNSPPELQGPMPTVRSLKRRFGVDDLTPTAPQPSLQNMFAAPPTPASRPLMRNRGFSLGDMGATNPQIAGLFTQRSTLDQTVEESPEIPTDFDYLAAPQPQELPRLGSPFAGGSSNARYNTFPRRLTPQESDMQALPFEERLRQLAAMTNTTN